MAKRGWEGEAGAVKVMMEREGRAERAESNVEKAAIINVTDDL